MTKVSNFDVAHESNETKFDLDALISAYAYGKMLSKKYSSLMRLNSKSKGRKNDKEFYKEICTGGKEAPVCIVFDEYKTFLHYYLRGQKGKNKTSRKSLRIEKYAEFIRYVPC